MLQIIPYDVMVGILAHFQPVERSQICHVSKLWYEIILDAGVANMHYRYANMLALGVVQYVDMKTITAIYKTIEESRYVQIKGVNFTGNEILVGFNVLAPVSSIDQFIMILSDYHLVARLRAPSFLQFACLGGDINVLKRMYERTDTRSISRCCRILVRYAYKDPRYTVIFEYFRELKIHSRYWSLWYVAKHNNEKLLNVLLDKSDDINYKQDIYKGALRGGNLELAKKYTPDVYFHGSFAAGSGGDLDCIKYCINYEVSIADFHNGWSRAIAVDCALEGACNNGRAAAIKWLVQQGGDVSQYLSNIFYSCDIPSCEYILAEHELSMEMLKDLCWYTHDSTIAEMLQQAIDNKIESK